MDVFENQTLHICAVPALLLVTVKRPPLISTTPNSVPLAWPKVCCGNQRHLLHLAEKLSPQNR